MLAVNVNKFLRPDERVIVVVREFIIANLLPWLLVTIMYFGWLFIMYWLVQRGWWGVTIFVCGYIGTIVYAVRLVVQWRGDVVLVTNRRLLDIHRRGFFSVTVRDLPWNSVHDIQYTQRGIWATLWHYGTIIVVLTSDQTIQWQHVYQPQQIRDILSDYVSSLH